MKHRYIILLFFSLTASTCVAQLKSMVYDFEGLDIGQTDLPEGDYHKYDMNSAVAANPLGESEMLGNRVLKASMTWNSGKAVFGKGISRFIELSAANDRFNFYTYDPLSNAADATVDVIITEDDNKNNVWEDSQDDRWKKTVVIHRSSSWQLISLPLSSFSDNNSGGNGIFDAAFTGEAGKIFTIEFDFRKTASETSSTVYLDMICFSEGALPVGSTILNYPAGNSNGHCILGAFASNSAPQTTPSIVEGLFPADPNKKLKYVNWFLDFSQDGTTTADNIPGSEVTQLLQNGYTPVITWEAMFSHLSRLDPAQPRLNDLLSNRFDAYIDAFADKLKSYNDTIIIRFMHEFEGDWYPWSLAENGGNANLYISVYRKFVNRVRARGATKVKWMWCINSTTYHPVLAYNWIISAYPGDAYVDIVACEAYNLSIPGIPYWRSFRMGLAEPYYYLRKYFPGKPMFICENGCRERYSSEDPSSQTKAQWLADMDKELQHNFHNVQALLFFNISKSQDYRLNSSAAALSSVQTNIWNDNYYFRTPSSAVTVDITAPATNSSFSPGADILIQASAGGGTGGIKKVEFFSGTLKLGEDLTSPYSYTWNNVSAGSYNITAKATDNSNNTGTSSVVHINVEASGTPDELIAKGSSWKYLDNGSNQGTAWRAASFSTSSWKTGNAILGYGNGNEATVVSYGGSSGGKYITTYFRKTFSVADASIYNGLELDLLRDDGAVVYLNGTEICRSNMPSGTIYYNTLAPSYIDGAAESAYVIFNLSSARLVNGTNTIAVEIHQNSPNSSDIAFDLQLRALQGTKGVDSVVTQTEEPFRISDPGADLLIYPNPNSGMFTLEFCLEGLKENTVKVEVLNSLGQNVLTRIPAIHDGCIKEVIELDRSLPRGIYILNVQTGKATETKRVLLSE